MFFRFVEVRLVIPVREFDLRGGLAFRGPEIRGDCRRSTGRRLCRRNRNWCGGRGNRFRWFLKRIDRCGWRTVIGWRCDDPATMWARPGRRGEIPRDHDFPIAVRATEIPLIGWYHKVCHFDSIPTPQVRKSYPVCQTWGGKLHATTAAVRTESSTSRQRWFCASVPIEIRTQSGSL